MESVAAFPWNGWQPSSGISGSSFGLEYASEPECAAAPWICGREAREWISGNGKTIAATADLLGASTSQLNRVLAGKVRLSATLAARLERLGWSTAEVWSRMQAG